jgi:hypothetical protein
VNEVRGTSERNEGSGTDERPRDEDDRRAAGPTRLPGFMPRVDEKRF